MNTYKYSFVVFNPNTYDLQNKCWGQKKYYLEDWLRTATLNYSIPNRERVGKVWYMGRSRRKPVIETEMVDWRWTIYNIKVIGIKAMPHYFKITFKVKATPKEAYNIGEGLKALFKEVSYKVVKQG